MLDSRSDRIWDLFDRSRSKIGLVLLGFIMMVPLALLGVESRSDSPDGIRLYPIFGSSESEQDEGSEGFGGAADFGLDGGSSEKSPGGPNRRRGNGGTSTGDGKAVGRQSSVGEDNVRTLGPERIEPLGFDDETLDSSEAGTTVELPTMKRPVTTLRKAETTTTLRRSTTVTRRRTTTTIRRTTKRRRLTTRKSTTVPRPTVVTRPQATPGSPPPTGLLDDAPPKEIDN